jgi:hypothetical protein
MNTEATNFGPLGWNRVEAALTESAAAFNRADASAWSWRRHDSTIELRGELPAVLDSRHRELMLVGGALLLNLRLLVRGMGAYVAVRIMPDPGQHDLVAVVRAEGAHPVTPDDRTLVDAVVAGRNHRTPDARPVTPNLLTRLRRAARLEQTWLAPLPEVPAIEATAAARSPAGSRVDGSHSPAAAMPIVIGTVLDAPSTRLQSGQAMQRVLLTAAVNGVPARPERGALHSTARRADLRSLIGGGLWPQAMLLVGASADESSAPIASR